MRYLLPKRLRFTWRYLRGTTPWDSGIVPPEVTSWIETHESNGEPPGHALDLGCGTGTTSIYLARHGWQAVGVDFAPNAIWQARRKAEQQHVADHTTFYTADVSQLDFLPDRPPFDLVVDIGCLHGLTSDQRHSYAAHLVRLTRPGAAYLLYAFMPIPNRPSGHQIGIDPDGVQTLFGPAFVLVDHTLGEEVTNRADSGWYTLRRVESAS